MEMIAKPVKVRSKKLRDSAKGQACTLQIPGICNHNNETTVLAHVSCGDKGMATKPSDLSACFACSCCHDAIDGRVPGYDVGEQLVFRAILKTQHKWVEMGLLKVEGMA